MDLSFLHGKKLAVVVVLNEHRAVVIGFGSYEPDVLLGNILRIQGSDDSTDPALNVDLIIRELEWDGNIERDTCYGCDYSFVLETPA